MLKSKHVHIAAISLAGASMVAVAGAQTHRFDLEGWGDATGSTRSVTETSLVGVQNGSGAHVLDLERGTLRPVASPHSLTGEARITALSNNGTAAGSKGSGFFYETPDGANAVFTFLGMWQTLRIHAVTDRLEFGGSSVQGRWGFTGPAYQRGPNETAQSLQGGLYGGWFETHGAEVTDLRQDLGGSATGTAVGVADTNAADMYRTYHFRRDVQSALGGFGDASSTRITEPISGSSGFEMAWAKVNSNGDVLVGFRDSYGVTSNWHWYSKVFWADGTVQDLPFVGTGINRWGAIVGWDSSTLEYKVMYGSQVQSLSDVVADAQGLDFKRRNQDIGLLDISDAGWIVGQSQLAGTPNNSETYWFATKVNPVPEPTTVLALGLGSLLLLRRRKRDEGGVGGASIGLPERSDPHSTARCRTPD